MKKLFFLVALVTLANVGFSQVTASAPAAPKADLAVFETSSITHDFGKIKAYKFESDGMLIIVNIMKRSLN